MKIFFLSADKAINKRYTKTKAGLTKRPYPFVYEVTSTEYNFRTLQELGGAIHTHANKGDCLVKGVLARPLVSESRAGTTPRTAKTDWVCLDLDGIGGYSSVDTFLHSIGCGNVDYILQWSSSYGIDGGTDLRCHIFMLLAADTTPDILKRWLQTLNLTIPALHEQLRLTRTNCGLCWGLDITTCQNDKLLYIAPPEFVGMEDPMKGTPRISLVQGKHRRLTIVTDILEASAIKNLTDKRINELRDAKSIPKRKTKYKMAGSVEYSVAPDTAVVTDIRTERGFVYLNINNGDSWGYYHPENNPTFIYNFKGEPTYKTEELLPQYWAEVMSAAKDIPIDGKGTIYLAFRDFRTSQYYNGWYDAGTKRLTLAMAKSEGQLKDFLAQHGQRVGDFVPDWNLVFNPHSPLVIDADNKTINTYVPSVFFESGHPPKETNLPPVCAKIIQHVLGDDPETVDYFINWLACVVQFLDRTGTAWIMTGTQGTGKGLLFHNILTPLFGAQNVVAKRMEELESEFTGFLENKFITAIDEIEVGTSAYHAKITAKLKNLIVEPSISIRKMYSPPYMARNFNNMIFASNKPNPVFISPDDRRYNVAFYQPNKIAITTAEVEDVLPKELEQLYAYLMHYPADRDKARVPLMNAAKAALIDLNRAAIDVVSDAILSGDMKFFWEQLPSEKPVDTGLYNPQFTRYLQYRTLLEQLLNSPADSFITRDELLVLYEYCDNTTPSSPNKFTALLKHHRITIAPHNIKGRTVRGIKVSWGIDEEWRNGIVEAIKAGKV